ncbi:MAG: ABC transporter ATP-binding protein [Bifidobacteriaceae bacterium]|jgi:ABC-2 type transport system ATP-binding protein|nr:ABC transporter ATP-binding protein [Bifidobacteriaceae bacterium]
MSQPAIETHDLTKRYGKARGITDINLTVNRGEIFGFIGPNGAGKSTTIRTLLGLISKTSGSATVLGYDITNERKEMLAHVGYLPSEVFYYDGMRAKDLLKYAASFYDGDFTQRIQDLAARLDLDLSKRIDDMSLGNKKKVGIIQGLLHSPDLIILDEPTSGLDPLAQRTFFDLIREENERGATVLFSSHILSEVQNICDRVAIIRDGRIIETQSIAELRRTAVKRVSVTAAGEVPLNLATLGLPAGSFAGAETEGPQTSFVFNGDCNVLLSALAARRLADVNITEPSLEEIFMHYYQDGADRGGAAHDSAAQDGAQR